MRVVRILIYDGSDDHIFRTLRDGGTPANGTGKHGSLTVSSRTYLSDGSHFDVNDFRPLEPDEVQAVDEGMRVIAKALANEEADG